MKNYITLKPANIREENIKQIIRLFLNTSKLYSRAQLSRRLSLSAPTITAIINDLIEFEILFESKEGSSSSVGGRKPILLDINKERGFILGVNLIYNNKITLVIANITGDIKHIATYNYQIKKEQCLNYLIDKIEQFLIINNIEKEKLLTIGITVPAYYDTQLKTIKYGPNIQMWHGVPIKEGIEEVFKTVVVVENAVNSAMQGEYWKGKISNLGNAVYVKVDKGIGAGILINGQLYKGYRNIAGEIGYMIVDKKFIPKGYNLAGALEQNFSTKTIIKKANFIKDGGDFDFKDIVNLAQDGDEELYNLLKEAAENIAIGIANLISVLSPEIVVIGGEFSSAALFFLDEIKSIVNSIVLETPQIVVSELGNQVYYLGAIFQALNFIEDRLVQKCLVTSS